MSQGGSVVSDVNGFNRAQVKVTTFASSGTYTPTAGMVYCVIECVGGGGGSGGVSGSAA